MLNIHKASVTVAEGQFRTRRDTVASETGVLVEAHWMILRTDICPTFWADTVHVLQGIVPTL